VFFYTALGRRGGPIWDTSVDGADPGSPPVRGAESVSVGRRRGIIHRQLDLRPRTATYLYRRSRDAYRRGLRACHNSSLWRWLHCPRSRPPLLGSFPPSCNTTCNHEQDADTSAGAFRNVASLANSVPASMQYVLALRGESNSRYFVIPHGRRSSVLVVDDLSNAGNRPL